MDTFSGTMTALGFNDLLQLAGIWELKVLRLQHLDHDSLLELWNFNVGSIKTLDFRSVGRLDLETFDFLWH